MIKGLVSIIIPTHKGADPSKCIESLLDSEYKRYEILVIDENKERSVQRNIGIRKSRGEFILYLDSDQYISKGLLGECVTLMKLGWDAVYIPEIIVTDNWFGVLRNWERRFYTGTAVDCIRFFRREGCPMFDETMSGPEDADFDHRVKGKKTVSRNPLYHDNKVDFFKYISKKIYYTGSMEQYRKKWPDDKVLNTKYRCFDVFVENGKWKMLLRKPHFAVAIFILIFIRGIIYICRKR